MSQDDKIHNPVEQYMKRIMDQDRPEKPPETTAKPAQHLEIKGGKQASSDQKINNEAVRLSDTLKQSVNLKTHDAEPKKPAEGKDQAQLFNIRRHPVGIIFITLIMIVSYAAVFTLVSSVLPGLANIIGIELSTLGLIVGLLMLIALAVGLFFLFITARNYLLSRLILTDYSVVHVSRPGLFGREIYELSIPNIEDVAIERTGIFSSLFNYGTIVVESSKGRGSLIFKYAPDPETHAKAIQYTKLEYLSNHRATAP